MKERICYTRNFNICHIMQKFIFKNHQLYVKFSMTACFYVKYFTYINIYLNRLKKIIEITISPGRSENPPVSSSCDAKINFTNLS